VVTNDSGTIKDDIDFYPYGGERAVVGPSSGNHYLFTGKERDSESGLDNFGARYMSSQYGRFMTPDSTGYSSLANPQAWNLYAYTLNNPLKYKDPSGHTVECGSDAQKCQAAIAASTANAEAAKRVTLQSTPHSFLGLFHWTTNTIQIAGDINSFRELGQNASRLADLVTDSRTIKFGVASSYSENAISLWGKLNDASSKELNNGGQSLLPSEDQNPAAYVNSDPSSADSEARKEGIPGANLGETTAHELLGHVWGELVGGHPAYPPGTENGALNKRDAVNSENAVRATDPSRGQKQNHD
jgi:RHS repeat-associated protein